MLTPSFCQETQVGKSDRSRWEGAKGNLSVILKQIPILSSLGQRLSALTAEKKLTYKKERMLFGADHKALRKLTWEDHDL